MKFLYSNDNVVSGSGGIKGMFAALTGSTIFWILIVLLIVLLVLLIMNPTSKTQQIREKLFGGANLMQKGNDDEKRRQRNKRKQTPDEKRIENIMRETADLIEEKTREATVKNDGIYRGPPLPDLEKTLDFHLDEEDLRKAETLGGKNDTYDVISMKTVLLKLTQYTKDGAEDLDTKLENVNFKLWLREKKKRGNPKNPDGWMRLYSDDLKCMGVLTLNLQKLTMELCSPFTAGNFILPLDKQRLLNFTLQGNELMVNGKKAGKVSIYDHIRYIQIKCSHIESIHFK
jgi:hypothetical protein